MTWRKSSHSDSEGNCVEVAFTPVEVSLRDSKNPDGPTLTVTPERWRVFLARLR